MLSAANLCFLDVETTGGSSSYDRIIDIGIIKSDGKRILQKYESLINPGTRLSPFITNLTGITDKDLDNAPPFYEIKDEILEILKDSILVAHSARFDYGFLKGEFRRFETSFKTKHMCSVKLARKLYPELPRYNLDTIISTFGIKCKRRHRAFDDAKVVFDFYKLAQKTISESLFEKAIDFCLKRPSLPIGIDIETLENLPESPGVYIFYGDSKFPLYIGKSVNIHDRVLSHFSNDLISSTDREIADQVKSIEYIETSGELSALLLESTLIKKHQPLYNQQLRYARKMTILVRKQTENGYASCEIKQVDQILPDETANVLGTFRSIKQVKDMLYNIAKVYSLCPKVLGLEKAKGKCFYYDLKYCRGACCDKELNLKYNLRFEEAFYKYKIKKWMFDGPIVIKEKGSPSRKATAGEEGFVVDKWCLLGNIKSENEIEELSKDYSFDLDTYKILAKFLKNPEGKISIYPITL